MTKYYEVEFFKDRTGTRTLLFEDGQSELFIGEDEDNEGCWKQYFTKQEIKKHGEAQGKDYWQFAVPVEGK